jgi:TPP-dependent pyruvate/acetoin dehydrogenase alpha subunit
MAFNVLQPISHVGDMVPVVTGIALAAKMRGIGDRGWGNATPSPIPHPPVVLTWIGDGSVKAGATHEGFNFAAVQKVPAIFIVQDNRVALGTRFEQHHLAPDFHELPGAYGMSGAVFDGNNVLDAWAATKLAAGQCRAGNGPVMLIAATFRMGGHATHDEAEARVTFPAEWFAAWGRKDPVGLYEEWLKGRGVSEAELAKTEAAAEAEVANAEQDALRSRETAVPQPASALEGVYAR